jgi:dihydrolipoamide dehydrogenase
MEEKMDNFDIIIIGSGPGGYVAAIRAAQLGKKLAVVEDKHLGGICLNWGCIPTKALLRSAELFADMKNAARFGIKAENVQADFPKVIQRSRQVADRLSKGVGFLFKKNNITVLEGRGKILNNNKVEVTNSAGEISEYAAKNIIIATGARARSFPNMPIDHEKIITYKEALASEEQPESIAIIGAGAIGVEFAYFFRTLGSQVTIIEMLPQLLPIEDAESSAELTRSFKKSGIKVLTDTKVISVSRNGEKVDVLYENKAKETLLSVDKTLVAVGVQGNIENLGLEEMGIDLNRGWIKVDGYMQTNVEGIYAIGDVAGAPWLAHVASAEGIKAVEHIAGLDTKPMNYDNIPGCTYAHPQVASIGLTEAKAREIHGDILVGKMPFRAVGKSLALGDQDGFVKLIAHPETKKLLGAHIVGPEATELLGELGLARSAGLSAESLLHTIHAHPTLSEAIMEAAADIFGEAIHI